MKSSSTDTITSKKFGLARMSSGNCTRLFDGIRYQLTVYCITFSLAILFLVSDAKSWISNQSVFSQRTIGACDFIGGEKRQHSL